MIPSFLSRKLLALRTLGGLLSSTNYSQRDVQEINDASRKEELAQIATIINLNIQDHAITSLIDVGCGTAEIWKSLELAQINLVVGIDPSTSMLLRAKVNTEPVQAKKIFLKAKIYDSKFPHPPLDLSICLGLFGFQLRLTRVGIAKLARLGKRTCFSVAVADRPGTLAAWPLTPEQLLSKLQEWLVDFEIDILETRDPTCSQAVITFESSALIH